MHSLCSSLPQYFDSPYAYDSTALHELAHATGAAHRLNRNIKNVFGTEDYAYEELIAEISSCFMSANLQLEQSNEHIENHKAYVQSWIETIREKPESLVKAVQQAEKVDSYMEYKAELLTKENKIREEVIYPKLTSLLSGETTPEEMYQAICDAAYEAFGEENCQ